ncbi:MAG: fibronectin type III domain-containing protein, partial [Eubacteriales bacterium]|nr:fibronectin type III domain-containing protein [Eubacteriales bacterium]
YIYRKPGIETDDFELIDTIYATTSYIDGNTNPLETGEAYFYYISAYRMSAGSRIEGAISATVNARSKPEQVQNLVVKPNTYTSLTLSWDACNGAAQYIILEKTWSAVTYSEIGRTVGNETTFDVDGLICGKIYYFRVVGIVTAEDDIVTQGEQSSTVSGRARPGVPANFGATCISGTTVRLTWDAPVAGATGYYIMRSTEEDNNYTKVGTVTSADRGYYYDSGLTTAETYYYKICAYVTYASASYEGEYGDYISVRPMPGKPVITNVYSYGCTSLYIKWNALSDVNGYKLMYSAEEFGDYEVVDIASGTATSYKLIDKVQAGQTIYVKLQSYVYFNEIQEFSEVSDIVEGSAKPSQVKNFKVSSGTGRSLVLTWDAVDGTGDKASGYNIYECTDASGAGATPIYDTRSGSTVQYTITGLDVGEYYYYYISAYCGGASGENIEGVASNVENCSVKPVAPSNLTATSQTYNSIFLEWDAVDGADGYEIYYGTDSNCKYRLASIAEGDATDYLHENVTRGRLYYYKIRSYSIVNENNYLYSAFSSAKSQYSCPGIPQNIVGGNSTVSGKPRISWDAVDGASSYVVYYSTSENGEYLYATSVSSSYSYAYVAGRTPGRTYWFKVKSRLYYGSTARYSEDFSEAVAITVQPSKPSSVTGTVKSYQSVYYKWSGVSGADGYKITCKLDDGTIVLEKDVGNVTSYTLTDKAISGRYINTVVTAYSYSYEDHSVKIYGPGSTSTVRTLARLSAPTGVSIYGIDNSTIRITWNAVSNAEGYCVQRRVGTTGDYETIKWLINTGSSSSNLEYIDNDVGSVANIKDKVCYRVRAFIDNDGDYLYGAPSSYKYTVLRCAKVTGVEATPISCWSITVTWDSVEGADYYGIYRATSATGTYSYIGYTRNTTYTNGGRTTGKTYYYKVRGYFYIGSTKYYGPLSDASEGATPTLDSPSGLSAVATSASTVHLSWSRTSGASGYYLYRSATENGTYNKIKYLGSSYYLSYNNTGRTADTTYYYKIRAFRYVGSTKIMSEYAAFDPVTTLSE